MFLLTFIFFVMLVNYVHFIVRRLLVKDFHIGGNKFTTQKLQYVTVRNSKKK